MAEVTMAPEGGLIVKFGGKELKYGNQDVSIKTARHALLFLRTAQVVGTAFAAYDPGRPCRAYGLAKACLERRGDYARAIKLLEDYLDE